MATSYGFMGVGAQINTTQKKISDGQMGVGSVKASQPEKPVKPEPTAEEIAKYKAELAAKRNKDKTGSKAPDDKAAKKATALNDYAELKKQAIAKGYKGESMKQKDLLEFLNSNQ